MWDISDTSVGLMGHLGNMGHLRHMGHFRHMGHLWPLGHIGLGHMRHLRHIRHLGYLGTLGTFGNIILCNYRSMLFFLDFYCPYQTTNVGSKLGHALRRWPVIEALYVFYLINLGGGERVRSVRRLLQWTRISGRVAYHTAQRTQHFKPMPV